MLIEPPLQRLKSLPKRILQISFDLFKVMVPVVLIVKLVEELGGIELIAKLLAPLMQLVGLPASMGLVWATTLLINIYGGMIIFINLAANEPLSVAQVTILATMMLFAHSLPVESSVAKKAGLYLRYSLLLRLSVAFVAGFILHQYYLQSSALTEANTATWLPTVQTETLLDWGLFQLQTLLQIFIIIAVLVSFLDILKISGIERLFIWALQPLLKLLGLHSKVTSMTIVGMSLGLTYGGALLISEARQGLLSVREIFGAITLISLCHGLIEDTILVMLLGAHISGVLVFRVLFSLVLVGIGLRIANQLSDETIYRYFAKSVSRPEA